MDVILMILMMVVIGAIIGGLTNSLAIKMLFRPYAPKYIGKFKVPFTPGLIPKRQSEIARQMGKTVVEHLLTPEALKKKINHPLFYEQVLSWVKKEMNTLSNKSFRIEDILNKLNLSINESHLKEATMTKVEEVLNNWIFENRHKLLKEVLPNDFVIKGENFIPVLSQYITDQLNSYISGPEGKEKIGRIAESYLDGRGFFGNMISSFLGGSGLSDKIQPVIQQYLKSEEAHEMLTNLLKNEWNKILMKELNDIEPYLAKHKVANKISEYVISFVSFEKIFRTDISLLYKKYEHPIQTEIIPRLVLIIQNYLVEKIAFLMGKMNLQEIVREEVANFDLHRLEDMVLGISKRELKMITYLGALLGGLIGLLQSFIVIVLQ